MNDNTHNSLTEELQGDVRQLTGNTARADSVITPEVLRRLKRGEHESFQKIYLHWRKPIRKFLFDLTGSEEEADDLTQEIFAVLWRYREKIDPDRNIRSLLFLVARRTAYKSNRAKLIRKRYADSVWAGESDYFTSHDMVVEKETKLLQQALLQRMPPQQRKIFEMNHNEGLSPEEIAGQLGIKRESVYNQLSRARKTLRDAILSVLVLFI